MLDGTLLKGNHLLAALPSSDRARLLPDLEEVSFKLGAVLYESGDVLRHLYFPTTALISLLFVTESGASTELTVTGRDGVVGIGLFMGGESTPSRAVVQIAGSALRLPAAALLKEFKLGGPFSDVPAPLHSGARHTNGADSRLQSASQRRPATVSLAPPQPGPHRRE